jgi:hypothetical protein
VWGVRCGVWGGGVGVRVVWVWGCGRERARGRSQRALEVGLLPTLSDSDMSN